MIVVNPVPDISELVPLFPLKPVGAEPPEPPPPTVTVYGELPEMDCPERFLKPPAAPPPPWSFPPPAPPPAIITVLILVVSESVVKVPEAVKIDNDKKLIYLKNIVNHLV